MILCGRCALLWMLFVGTLCADDGQPRLRRRTPEEIAVLQLLDDEARLLIELRALDCEQTYQLVPWYQKPFVVATRSRDWPSRVLRHRWRDPCLIEREHDLRVLGLLPRKAGH